MNEKPTRVDSSKWVDGGYPIDIMQVSRSAAVLVIFATGFTIAAGLLILGLVTNRMPVPWSNPVRTVGWRDLESYLGSLAVWLVLAVASLRGAKWALGRVRREWRQALRIRSMLDPKN